MQKAATINIGNANSYQAMTIADLNNVPSNANIKIESGAPINVYQGTQLDPNWINSSIERILPTQSAISSGEFSNVIMQFALTNWTPMSSMYLDVPITITYSTYTLNNNGTFDYYDPYLINNLNAFFNSTWGAFSDNTDFPRMWPPGEVDESLYQTLVGDKFTNCQFVQNYILQLFQTAQIFMGNNNQQLGRSAMQNQPHLHINALNEKYNDNTAYISGFSGIPISMVNKGDKGAELRRFNDGSKSVTRPLNSLDSDNINLTGINTHAVRSFEQALRSVSPMFGTTNVQYSSTNVTMSNTVVIPLKFSKIFEAFATDAWLPPGTKFKLVFQLFNTPQVVWYSGFSKKINNNDVTPTTFSVKAETNISIVYRNCIPYPSFQNEMNQRWNSNSFIYGFTTCEPQIIDTYPYRKVVSTSQQAPLELIFIPIANSRSDNTTIKEQVFFDQNWWVPWIDDNLKPIQIKRITINISGRTILDYDNSNNPNHINKIPASSDCVLFEQVRGTGFNTSAGGETQLATIAGVGNCYQGQPIRICLAPQTWSANSYPADKGALQVTVSIDTDNKLNSKFTLYCYQRYTTQYTLDTNLNVTIINWPALAIQTQSGNVLSTPNVVPGN